jgi:hypothetical protein
MSWTFLMSTPRYPFLIFSLLLPKKSFWNLHNKANDVTFQSKAKHCVLCQYSSLSFLVELLAVRTWQLFPNSSVTFISVQLRHSHKIFKTWRMYSLQAYKYMLGLGKKVESLNFHLYLLHSSWKCVAGEPVPWGTFLSRTNSSSASPKIFNILCSLIFHYRVQKKPHGC